MKSRVRQLLALLALLLVVQVASAQITGTVTGEDGEPLAGVSVSVKGTTTGVITQFDGKYTIEAAQGDVLVFSIIGMSDKEATVSGSTVDVAMGGADAQLMDDIVVVAYGTARKGTQTSAISTVKTPALKDLPVTSFENALQGAAAGVQVGTPNGQPGAQQEIRIRGIGSYNASNAPLYVIDGIPATSGDYNLAGHGGSTGVMSTINPSDIENISILKDAAATSLYGSRGANGVILVTTKRGKSGALKVNLKGSMGFNDFAMNNRPTLSGNQARTLTLEGAYNQRIYNGEAEAEAWANAIADADKVTPARAEYSDWEEALRRDKATNSNYEVSVSGGDEKNTFYTSLAYRKDLGMYVDSDLDAYTGTANFTHRNKGWIITTNSYFAKFKQNVTPGYDRVEETTAYANPYYASRTYLTPNIPIYNEDGSYYGGSMFSGSHYNLVAAQGLEIARNEIMKTTNSLSAAYEFTEGLMLKETLSYDHIGILGTTIWPSTSRNGGDYNGLTQQQDYDVNKLYSSLLLTYDKTFLEDHTVSALLGWDVDNTRHSHLYAAGSGFASTMLYEMAAAAKPEQVSSNHSDDRIVSYFGRANYSYKNRYNASLTYRRDGSSRLGANTRWGDFWSVSGSWKIKDEEFLKYIDQIDNLKLRASYGVSGTLPTDLYGSLATYSYTGAYNGVAAASPARVANPDMGWEKNYVFDLGLEARFFDRVNLEFDFYNRQTEDMLLDVPLSLATGFATTLLNYGGMNNRGVELNLGVDIFKGDFKWTSTLVLSHNRNKVTKLYNGEEISSGSYRIREGSPLYSFFMREWAGVDPGTGDSMWYIYEWEDADGNRTYAPYKPEGSTFTGNKRVTKDPDQATREIQAAADPKLTGGIRNALSWNGFDLDFLFSFSAGGTSLDNAAISLTGDGFYTNYAISELQLDRWQKPGDQTNFPRRMFGGGHGNYTSTRWLHSTNHIRLKSLTFGYTVPSKWTKKAYIQNLRAFVAGSNLLTWAAYGDYDPEVPISGEISWAIPALKSVTFGIEIGF
jgi:TonB-linked SusC/RagA family outer membrane protein